MYERADGKCSFFSHFLILNALFFVFHLCAEESRREAIRIDRSRRRAAQERLLRQAAVNTILFFLWLVSISEGHLLGDPQIRFCIFPLLIRFDTSSLETWLYFENSCRSLKAYIVLYYCLLASSFRFLRLLCYR